MMIKQITSYDDIHCPKSKDHSHYTSIYRSAMHTECNESYNCFIRVQIMMRKFIPKELAEIFKRQFE